MNDWWQHFATLPTRRRRTAILTLGCILTSPVLAWAQFPPGPHHAIDPNNPIHEWMRNVHRKWDGFACCGTGDAYPIQILVEPTPDGTVEDGEAVVLDGSRKVIADPATPVSPDIRNKLPTGTRFKFSGNKISKEADGNPTKTAWGFLRVDEDETIHNVYCVIPLPPGF